MLRHSVLSAPVLLPSILLGATRSLVSANPWVKTSASLPEFMADFEVNYNTGDLAAVSPVTNKAYLFRYDDVFAATTAPITNSEIATISSSQEVTVCTTPYSISYKLYQDEQDILHSYYGIVCTQVDKIFVLDAINFSLIAEISIGGLGASNIVSSRNPRDPFFYYNYQSGYYFTLAALDVRTMEDRGNIMVPSNNSPRDAAISADGVMIYTRNSWSSSSFLKSRELVTTDVWNQAGSTPSFNVVYTEYSSFTGPYVAVADTVNAKTASGRVIYSRTLESELGRMDFDVLCWGANSSYLFGFATQGYPYDMTFAGIMAASSEDFQLIRAEAALFPDEFTVRKDSLPDIPCGGECSSYNYNRMVFRHELIANDLHSELIVAFANQVSIIPYKCFAETSTSFVPNATSFFIGIGPQTIVFEEKGGQSLFSRDQISLTGLPEGAVFDSMARMMTWEPTEDQLGSHELLILAASEGKRGCYFNVTFSATYPSMKIPFKPSGISIADESSGLLVLWANRGEWDYYYTGNDFCPEQNKGCLSAMSLARAHSPQLLIATKYFDFSIEHIFATRDRIVVATPREQEVTRQTFYIFDAVDQVESLASFTVNRETYSYYSYMNIEDRTFRIKDATRLKVIDLYTYEVNEHELLHGASIHSSTSDGTSFSPSETSPVREGFIQNGVLWNSVRGDPTILIDRGPFSLDMNSSSHFPSWLFPIPKYIEYGNKLSVLYEAGICLQSQTVQRGPYNDRWNEVLIHVLDLDGNYLGTRRVLEKSNDASHVLATAKSRAYLAHSNLVYTFKGSDLDFSNRDSATLPVPRSKLHFAPNQTLFCVQSSSDIGLHHTVLGGRGPFNLFVNSPQEVSGLRLDASTGIISLNGTEFMIKAREALVKHFTVDSKGGFEFLAASRKCSEPIMYLDGCLNPNELPVSREISLNVVDQNGDTASISYYVFIGVPYDAIAPLVMKWQQSSSATSPSCDCSCLINKSTSEWKRDGIAGSATNAPSASTKIFAQNVTTTLVPVNNNGMELNETVSPKDETGEKSEALPVEGEWKSCVCAVAYSNLARFLVMVSVVVSGFGIL